MSLKDTSIVGLVDLRGHWEVVPCGPQPLLSSEPLLQLPHQLPSSLSLLFLLQIKIYQIRKTNNYSKLMSSVLSD